MFPPRRRYRRCCCGAFSVVLVSITLLSGGTLAAGLGEPGGSPPAFDYRKPGVCDHLMYHIREEREELVVPGPDGYIEFATRLRDESYNPPLPETYDIERPQVTEIRPLPVLLVTTEGRFADIQARTTFIVEQLNCAFDILNHGGTLEIISYGGRPSIWARASSGPLRHLLRVITIHQLDWQKVPRGRSAECYTAYVKSLLESYHALFIKRELPSGTPLAQHTRQGRILKRIYLDAVQHAKEIRGATEVNGKVQVSTEDIREAIYMLDVDQRERLYNLPIIVPLDWQDWWDSSS